MHRTRLRLLTAAFAAAVLGALLAEVSAAGFAPQTSSERGVTVRVTPRDLSSAAKVWDFDIVLETHSQDLGDDVKAGATLVVGGAKHAPVSWAGDPPGGHHRKGLLSFTPVSPRSGAMELRIQRPGEPTPRRFQWQAQ